VFQGVVKAAGGVEDGLTAVRLWTHEVLRVFYDRWVDPKPLNRSPTKYQPVVIVNCSRYYRRLV
jgi:hypothetical protein